MAHSVQSTIQSVGDLFSATLAKIDLLYPSTQFQDGLPSGMVVTARLWTMVGKLYIYQQAMEGVMLLGKEP